MHRGKSRTREKAEMTRRLAGIYERLPECRLDQTMNGERKSHWSVPQIPCMKFEFRKQRTATTASENMKSGRFEQNSHVHTDIQTKIDRRPLGNERLEYHILNANMDLIEKTLIDNTDYRSGKGVAYA